MPYDRNNIFAKILRGEVSSVKVYEDENTLAFMDVMPQSEGHVLVVPKEEAEDLFALSDEALAALIAATRKVARAAKTALKPDGLTLMQFNGPAAGQTVFHVHFHIVPRWEGRPLHRHGGQMENREALEALAARIRAEL